MTLDRLQAAWPYTGAEIWRPNFKRFRESHPDLPIAIVRTMLVRPRRMQPIFVERGIAPALDRLRKDVDTFLDLPENARAALRRIKPHFFRNGRAIAILLSDIAAALEEYENPELTQAYIDRLQRFLQRHILPYRLDGTPLKLTPLLHGEVDALYRVLREKAETDARLQEALCAFENAWERQSSDWSQINAKEAIRTASLLAENMLVSAARRPKRRDKEKEEKDDFNKALERMRQGKRFPNNEFVQIFGRAYAFANSYPNIRHAGEANGAQRDLRKEDTLLSALVFVGLSACVHDLCADEC